ncbi:universal stress protein [Isachenkonia alkalipeptolytica]|uniref:Universal stress protein n=1 Tax=Isachenkonia alkalipeptolytica TaxID=2565777 RepID=A0AA44BFE5_9CLOT|nr:universal stress protein [Isachenkonia alkalipeptolytica]NBG88466.1 universal stress protein [Isachenkonia alkalipeptolytica]
MKLLVCFDGSDPSHRAIEKAHKLTGDSGVHEVTILHAYQENYWFSMGDGYAPSPDMLKKLENFEESQVQEKKEKILELAKIFDNTEVSLDVKTIHGHPARVITKVAEEGEYDLIIIGSRGLGGIRKVVLGSVSNAVMQGTKVSVMVVK